jgi:hypothetical protein
MVMVGWQRSTISSVVSNLRHMSETTALPQESMIAAAQNEWGKKFKLGDREFEIKDLPYFDYLEFIQLSKPLVTIAAGALNMGNKNGELTVDFDPQLLDFDQIIKVCGKELPRIGQIVCRQTVPNIKSDEVAILAHRPQRLIEIGLLQILHNNMIQEFGSFFQRLMTMTTVMLPDLARAAAPSDLSESATGETLS